MINRRSVLIGIGVVSLTGCKDDKPPVPPIPPPSPSTGWWLEHSTGVVLDSVDPPIFNFPPGDGVHALVTSSIRPSLSNTINLKFLCEGVSNLVAFNGGQPAGSPYLSLFLQRVGDNLSGQGPYADYRFYSKAAELLSEGEHSMSVLVSPSVWHNVWGQESSTGFYDTLANLRVFGLVFGNPSAGATAHGVGGGGKFTMLECSMQ